jgi:Sulfotransferase domain
MSGAAAQSDLSAGGCAPRIVAAIGLHGSASTWVFNVTRELMTAAVGLNEIISAYAEEPSQLPSSKSTFQVIKSHHGSAELDAWLKERRARLVLSLRDPRDAAVSMSRRFSASLAQTVVWLADDCRRMMRLVEEPHLLLRYEDRFFDDPASVERIAQWLGLDLPSTLCCTIFGRYETEAVRTFAAGIAQLPADRIVMAGRSRMDAVTQFHEPHIGDGRSGKWRELPAPAREGITRIYRPFLERFGYPMA